jgi:hypothetical protein
MTSWATGEDFAALLRRCASEEGAAWKDLYGACHAELMVAFRRRRLADPNLRDEMAHQALVELSLRMRRRGTSERDPAHLVRGLAVVAWWRFLNQVARRRPETAASGPHDAEDLRLHEREVRAAVEEFLPHLRGRLRQFFLSHLLGRPGAEELSPLTPAHRRQLRRRLVRRWKQLRLEP